MTGEASGNVFVRTDSAGGMLWSRSYGNPGTGYAEGWSVQQTNDGGFVVAGRLSRRRLPDDPHHWFGPDYDAHLVRTDSNGDSLWTRTYGDKRTQGGNWVRQTADGGFIMVGHNIQTTSGGLGPGDVKAYIVRTDASGDTLWTPLSLTLPTGDAGRPSGRRMTGWLSPLWTADLSWTSSAASLPRRLTPKRSASRSSRSTRTATSRGRSRSFARSLGRMTSFCPAICPVCRVDNQGRLPTTGHARL
jgi:hypothetical protein